MIDEVYVPWRRLGAAILVRACKDAIGGNGHSVSAWAFLTSITARDLTAALDISPDRLAALLATLPEPAQYPLFMEDDFDALLEF